MPSLPLCQPRALCAAATLRRRDSVLCLRPPLTGLLVLIFAFFHVFWESSSNLSSLPVLSYLFYHRVSISKKLLYLPSESSVYVSGTYFMKHSFLSHEALISIFCCVPFEILFFLHNLGFLQCVFYFGFCFLCYIFSPICSQ